MRRRTVCGVRPRSRLAEEGFQDVLLDLPGGANEVATLTLQAYVNSDYCDDMPYIP